MAKLRLDKLLVELGILQSRERAHEAITRGEVLVDGKPVTKAGAAVDSSAHIEFCGHELPYVSRGGLKLEKAIEVFSLELSGVHAADIGASTGGFTDCMLRAGAEKVYAIDVGSGQLAQKLINDPRVVNMEHTNIRDVTPDMIGEKLDFATIDVSFISLKLVLPHMYPLLKENSVLIALVKPQFEAGRENIGKKGVVRDPAVHIMVLEKFLADATNAGFAVTALDFSPIRGPEGNIEYLAHLTVGGKSNSFNIAALVAQSHTVL